MTRRSVLINALSGFWHRFFRDLSDFDAMYEGFEALGAQLYLDLLYETLGNDIEAAPLIRRENYRLRRITLADVKRDAHGAYVELEQDVRHVRYLQDAPVAPGTVLALQGLPGPRLPIPSALNTYLVGMATRPVALPVSGVFTLAGGNFDQYAGAGATLRIADGRDYEVLFATPTQLYFKTPAVTAAESLGSKSWSLVRPDGATAHTGSGGAFSLATSAPVTEYAVWLTDLDVDDQLLYRTAGNLVDPLPQPSTKQYRAFISAVLELYVKGPSVQRLESALSVAAGFPVARTDGEVVTGFYPAVPAEGFTGSVTAGNTVFTATDAGIDFDEIDLGANPVLEVTAGGQTIRARVSSVLTASQLVMETASPVTGTGSWRLVVRDADLLVTSARTYEIPPGAVLSAKAATVGATLNALDLLTDAVNVVDYVKDPNWWHGVTIPETIMPGLAFEARRATASLFPNEIGPTSGWRIGDPGFLIGGEPLPNGDVASVHHTPAFTIVDRYLKRNMFGVRFAPYVETAPGAIEKLRAIVEEVRPSGTYAYVWPQTDLTETITLVDDLLFKAHLGLPDDVLHVPDSNWHVGDGTLGSGLVVGGAYTPAGTGIREQPVTVTLK